MDEQIKTNRKTNRTFTFISNSRGSVEIFFTFVCHILISSCFTTICCLICFFFHWVHYNSSQLLGELLRIGRDSISQDVGIEEDPLLLTLEK